MSRQWLNKNVDIVLGQNEQVNIRLYCIRGSGRAKYLSCSPAAEERPRKTTDVGMVVSKLVETVSFFGIISTEVGPILSGEDTLTSQRVYGRHERDVLYSWI